MNRRNDKPRRERRPEDRHARASINELIDAETRHKLEKLLETLSKEENR